MVSLTFDDGTEEVYQNAIPILNAAHLKSTQYIITNYLDGHDPNFMDASQVQTLYHQGHEIASHTQSHQDLTSMSMERVDTELQGSKKDLENLGIPVVDFAYPGGLYNQPVEAAVQRAGYESGRKLENGLPLKGGNPMEMPAIIVTSDIPVTKILDLCVWAQNNGRWLVLVFHRVTPAPELDLTGKHLSITTGELKSIVNLLISHKMNVVTIQQGLATESKLLQ